MAKAFFCALLLQLFRRSHAQLQISMGHFITCALWDNDYKCWGLGRNLTTVTTPPDEPYDFGDDFQATKIISGPGHHCIISTEGQARCWGLNGNGRLGDGSTVSVEYGTPLNDINLGSDYIVADGGLGKSHSCFLSTNAMIKCFGSNSEVWISF